MFYHLGEEFRTGQADFLAREGNLYITSGVYDDSELAHREIAARQKNPDYWGDSIGFWVTEPPEKLQVGDAEIPVYTRGINYEISTLPEEHAASWLTNYTSIQEVTRQMNEKQKEIFRNELFDGDEDAADEFLNNLEGVNLSIKQSGQITREQVDDEIEEDVEVDDVDEEIEDDGDEIEEPEIETEEVEISGDVIQSIVDQTLEVVGERIDALETENQQLRQELEDVTAAQRVTNVKTSRRIDVLEKSEEALIQEISADMPRGRRRLNVVLPREKHRDPDGEDKRSYAELAQETLSKMPA